MENNKDIFGQDRSSAYRNKKCDAVGFKKHGNIRKIP